MFQQLTIGTSACLLGEKVRYDGGHKHLRFCTEVLSQYADFKPMCPEVGIGLTIPRPTIRLENHDDKIIAVSTDGEDYTNALQDFGRQAAKKLNDIDGYIFCAKSPSCGMTRLKVYDAKSNHSTPTGVGLYAEQIMAHNPLLPVEESGRLNDLNLRENFVSRMYAYNHWRRITMDGISKVDLIDFHTQYKYYLMAHSITAYQDLGLALSNLNGDLEELAANYIAEFMAATKNPISRKQHTNVLQHIQGYFKKQLDTTERQEVAKVISEYREGAQPLLAPLALIRNLLVRYPDEYLLKQRYLFPYPKDMNLRFGI